MSHLLGDVAQRISKEVGTPPAVSYRIAKELNTLARNVDWADPVDRPGKERAKHRKQTRARAAKKHRSKRSGKRR